LNWRWLPSPQCNRPFRRIISRRRLTPYADPVIHRRRLSAHVIPTLSTLPGRSVAGLDDEQARSGLSQRVFCEQKELSKSSFQLWKRRLRSAGVAAPISSRPSDTEAALFAPVIVARQSV
jgi:hypothetical protein